MEHKTQGLTRKCNAWDLYICGNGLECANCGAFESSYPNYSGFVVVGILPGNKDPREMTYKIKQYKKGESFVILDPIFHTVNDAIAYIDILEKKGVENV